MVTKLDLFDDLDEIPLCYAYDLRGQELQDVPDEVDHAECQPRYKILPGWKTSTHRARRIADLPANARRYLDTIAELTGVPVLAAGVGPEREAIALP